jgi:hypothetical protein
MHQLGGYDEAVADEGLTERELAAWRTSVRMLELLRGRLEQQLQADSGLSLADYAVLSVLSETPGRRMRLYELGVRSRSGGAPAPAQIFLSMDSISVGGPPRRRGAPADTVRAAMGLSTGL